MRRNVGGCDRMLRVCGGFMLLALGLVVLGGLRGEVWGLVVAGVGILLMATGLTGFCPLYVPFGISTAGDGHWMGGMMAHCGPGAGGPEGGAGCCGRKGDVAGSAGGAAGHASRA